MAGYSPPKFSLNFCRVFVLLSLWDEPILHIPKDSGELACAFSVHTWQNILWPYSAQVILGFIDQQGGGSVSKESIQSFFRKQNEQEDSKDWGILKI